MKTIIFPGWASFKSFYAKELLEDFFYDISFQDEEVNVIAWSMGTLKALDYIKNTKVNKLILMAPTTEFLKENNPKLINSMIIGLKRNKEKTLKEFYNLCFSDLKLSEKFYEEYYEEINQMDTDSLIEGLKFLKNQKIDKLDFSKVKEVHIILGNKDKIIPIENNSEFLSFGKIYKFDLGHNFIYKNDELSALVRSIIND